MKRLRVRSTGGITLALSLWEPAHALRGEVLLVHGLGEHLGRYAYVAERLTGAGLRVTGVELRGHGESGGRRGHVRRFADYVEDLRAAAATIGAPHAILAHSMGGLVALDSIRAGAGDVRRLVLSSPLLGIEDPPPLKRSLARVLSRVLPILPFRNGIDPESVCSDPAVVDAYRRDPLVHATVTARCGTELLAALERVRGSASTYRTPISCHFGGEDRIVSTRAMLGFCDRYGGPVQTRGWDGLFHEILNEPARDEVLDEMIPRLSG